MATSQETLALSAAESGAEADFNMLGLVNADASVSVNTNKTFGTTSTVGGSTSINLLPQGDTGFGETSIGSITRQTQDASVTGDFDFTTAGGWIVYHVKNVTVTEQAIQDKNNPTAPTFDYGQQWTTETPTVPGN